MIYEEALLNALEDAGSVPFSSLVYRFTFTDQPPLRANLRGARWNPSDVAALYTSLEEGTARAEIEYLIRMQPMRPRPALSLARIRVNLARVVDLHDADALKNHFQLDLSTLPEDVSGYRPCQEIGGGAAFLGRSGIIVPSLRRPSARNLVIFITNLNPASEDVELVVDET